MNTTVTGSEEVDAAIGCAGLLLSLFVASYLVFHVAMSLVR